ncbi:hypothetical protein [Lewinella sp. IMCC34191]|uniref:hypothetical protein n=1 Tax=Lewinella sp. IMCC34191 TaxID=2259172 RepID=UPI000E260701|nr:hypothetical protein [Lewinella sp. IMCC34191]
MDLRNRTAVIIGALLLLSPPVSSQEPNPAESPLREGMVLNMRFLPESAADRDLQAKGQSTVTFLRGERGRHEDESVQLTLRPDSRPPTATTSEGDEDDGTDYLIIDAGDPIKKDWFKPGTIWGFHQILLLDSVDRSDFESFIHRYWAPTRSDALPDSKVIFLKELNGPQAGEFSYIWLIDSEETRDYYFPESTVPSEMYTEFEKAWGWIYEPNYLGRYLAAPEDELFTDYVVR